MMPSDCSCVYIDIDDSPDVYDQRTVRARRAHECGECRDEIPKGAKHEVCTVLWEGKWGRYRTCAACVEVRDVMFCEGWAWGECWARIREHFAEGAPLSPCFEEVKSIAGREKLTAAFVATAQMRAR